LDSFSSNEFNGIFISPFVVNSQVINCVTTTNGSTGINNNSPSSMIFTANASFNNATNYGTGGNTPTNVTIAASTSYWDNIIK
jgi:hypothetical protein